MHENKNSPSKIVCPIDCVSLQPPSNSRYNRDYLDRTVTYGSCSKPKTALPLAILMTGSRTKHCDLVNFVMTSKCLSLFEKLRYFFFFQNAMSFKQCFLDMGKMDFSDSASLGF